MINIVKKLYTWYNFYEEKGVNMKKYLRYSLFLLVSYFCLTNTVLAFEPLCERNNIIMISSVIGYLIIMAKIITPIALVVFGMLDLGKAVISSKDFSKSTIGFAKRIVAAIIIFIFPTTLLTLLKSMGIFDKDDSDYAKCIQCILNPNDKDRLGNPACKYLKFGEHDDSRNK